MVVSIGSGCVSKNASIVWSAAILVNVYLLTAPTDTLSTWTSETKEAESGVMLKTSVPPNEAGTAPEGAIDPWGPALAKTVNEWSAKLASIVWFAVTFVKVYFGTAPTETLSPWTSVMKYPVSGVIVKLWLPP